MMDAHQLVVWKRSLPGTETAALPPHNSRPNPTLAGQRLLISTLSPGMVHCVDTAEGRELWAFRLDGLGHSSVLVSGGMVYAQSARTLYALGLGDGKLAWKFTPHAEEGEHVYSAPVLVAGLLVFGDRRGAIHCLDVSTGSRVWTSVVAEHSVNSTFLVVGDRVVAATNDASVVGIDALTGALAWRTQIDGPSIFEVLPHGGGALIQTDSLWWVDPHDGTVLARWSQARETVQSVAIADDLLVVLLQQEVLIGLKGHKEVYRRPNQGFFRGLLSYSPATGCVYVERAREVRIVEPTTGELVCELKYGEGLFASTHPAVARNRLYILTHDGDLLALRHPDVRTG